jgi:hypothetical protein
MRETDNFFVVTGPLVGKELKVTPSGKEYIELTVMTKLWKEDQPVKLRAWSHFFSQIKKLPDNCTITVVGTLRDYYLRIDQIVQRHDIDEPVPPESELPKKSEYDDIPF